MKNQISSPLGPLVGDGKDTPFGTQEKRIFAAFWNQPKTMLMVSQETGMLRSNVCRYVAKLRRDYKIVKVYNGICPITRHPKVGFYTTNPELVKHYSKNDEKQ